MAEGVGFEPTVALRLRLISSQVPSTTQPPFPPQKLCAFSRARQAHLAAAQNRPQPFAQNFNQRGVHEFVVIGNKKTDAWFRGERLRKFLPQPFLVPLLHHHDDICPAQLTGSDFDARCVLRSRRAHVPRRFRFENRFRRQTAPPVAAADEKDFESLVDDMKISSDIIQINFRNNLLQWFQFEVAVWVNCDEIIVA